MGVVLHRTKSAYYTCKNSMNPLPKPADYFRLRREAKVKQNEQITAMLLNGTYTHEAIARIAGCSTKTIQRRRQQLIQQGKLS